MALLKEAAGGGAHRPGSLKQQNKPHKGGRHRGSSSSSSARRQGGESAEAARAGHYSDTCKQRAVVLLSLQDLDLLPRNVGDQREGLWWQGRGHQPVATSIDVFL